MGAYTSLLSALDRDGRWEVALDAFGDTVCADGVEVPRVMALFTSQGAGHQLHGHVVLNPWPPYGLKADPLISRFRCFPSFW